MRLSGAVEHTPPQDSKSYKRAIRNPASREHRRRPEHEVGEFRITHQRSYVRSRPGSCILHDHHSLAEVSKVGFRCSTDAEPSVKQ